MKQNAWLWYLALVVGLGQYYFVSAVGRAPNETLYSVIGATSLVAVAAGLVLHRPAARLGWSLVLASVALYLAGDYVYASLEESSAFVAFPSSADWIYLAMYPVLVAGIVLIRRAAAPGRARAGLVDGLVVAIAAFAVIGAVYMHGYLVDDTFGTQARLVASAYPVFDVVLVGCAGWMAVTAGRTHPPLVLLSAAIAAIVVGNAVYNVDAIAFAFEPGGVAELGWLGFTSLLGAAALHPAVGERRETIATAPRPLPAVRRWGLVAVVATIPLGHLVWGDADDVSTTLVAAALAASLVIARFVLAAKRAATSSDAGSTLHVAAV